MSTNTAPRLSDSAARMPGYERGGAGAPDVVRVSARAPRVIVDAGRRAVASGERGRSSWAMAPISLFKRFSVLLCFAGIPGCLELQSTTQNENRKCTACHGDERRLGDSLMRAAPPRDIEGRTATTERSVGAHALHLSNIGHAPVACDQCHIVPETVLSPSHIDSDDPAEVTFGTLSHLGERHPAYNADATCSDTYCHRDAQPQWNAIRDAKTACGTCHGLPPAMPHPQRTDCSQCHADVIDAQGKWVNSALHVNGKVEVRLLGKCAACHGSNPDTGAPPPDLLGNEDPSAMGVGAHEQHLNASESHAAVACAECHRVPKEVDDDGHIDADGTAEITFGTLASRDGARPQYDGDNGTCSNSYCHGVSSGNWRAPRDSVGACGSCHTLPPSAPHPQSQACSRCHARVVGPDQRIINASLHVNGSVEVDFSNGCSSCHGTGNAGAPAPDLSGNTQPSARGVGAHAQHLKGSATHRAVACTECHVVPQSVDEPSHIDGDSVPEVTFGALARANGHVPSYDRANVGCASTYCHLDAKPNWLAPRESAQACGTCHALPPAAPHPSGTDCSQCHRRVIDSTGRFIRPELHVNGSVEVSSMTCNSCHGTDPSGLPPPDSLGNSAVTARGVGAHALHALPSTSHSAIACSECHVVPTSVDAVGHRDSPLPAEVQFGSLASANGAKPEYSAALLTCKNTYCHGSATPYWTAPGPPVCDTCHAFPPKAPHPQLSECHRCHASVIDAAGQFVRPELHVDGRVQVEQSCSSCHGSAANPAPPTDTTGRSNPTQVGVGAHQAHLSGGVSGRPLACTECHVVPATIEAPGHLDPGARDAADVTLTGVAETRGRVPNWSHATATCTNTWCHGPSDADRRSPIWNAAPGDTSCTSCHGMPPPDPHTTISQCHLCHSGVDERGTITNRASHVNGHIDLL